MLSICRIDKNRTYVHPCLHVEVSSTQPCIASSGVVLAPYGNATSLPIPFLLLPLRDGSDMNRICSARKAEDFNLFCGKINRCHAAWDLRWGF